MVDQCRPSTGFFGADPPRRSPGLGMCIAELLNSPALCFLLTDFITCDILLPWSSRENTLTAPRCLNQGEFFPYGMDSKAEGRGVWRSHPKLDIPVFPSMVHPLLSSQTSQVLFLSMLFPRGTTSGLTSVATAALGWSCANHGFKTKIGRAHV